MITNFRVQNFKAFEDPGVIDLKALTLLSGTNSAGKSSLLQALLLLKQTLEASGEEKLVPRTENGLFLGTLDTLVFKRCGRR